MQRNISRCDISKVFLIKLNDTNIGVATLDLPTIGDFSDGIIIQSIYLKPKYRDRGIGGHILDIIYLYSQHLDREGLYYRFNMSQHSSIEDIKRAENLLGNKHFKPFLINGFLFMQKGIKKHDSSTECLNLL